jgi:fermentation-respiration switch protein FrsA (DUF1100 family)
MCSVASVEPLEDMIAFFSHFHWRLLRDLALLYLVFAGLVYFFQRKLQYFPDPSGVPLPHDPKYSGIETVNLATTDGLSLYGWYWPGRLTATLVMFHGNAGHRGHRLDWIEDLHRLGYGVFALDYRGYGGSEGSPSEEGFYRDGEATLRWLEKQGIRDLVYFGESLGCGVAVEMAERHPPLALILQSGFSSALDVARNAYPYLPVRLLMKDRFDSKQKIAKILCPILFIHGERDSIVPLKLGRALYEAANEPKTWFPIPEADHNDLPWVGGKTYLEGIQGFLERQVLDKQLKVE